MARFVEDSDRCAVAIDLEDRFSDSGTVAGAFARLASVDEAILDEIVVSCRALGRGLEEVILAVLLGVVHDALGGDAFRVRLRRGPRNEPAFAALTSVLGAPAVEGEVTWPWSEEKIETAARSFPADLVRD